MNANISVSLFGEEVKINYAFEARSLIERLDRLKMAVKQPQILRYTGLRTFEFDGYESCDEPYTSSQNVLSWVCRECGWDGHDIRGFILAHSAEDTAWTEQRNKDLTMVFYRRITLGHRIQELVSEKASEIQALLEEFISVSERKAAEEKKAAEDEQRRLLDGVSWTKRRRKISDEGGKTYEVTHIFVIGGETITVIERNLFDVGRVLNPESRNGIYTKHSGKWVIETHDPQAGWRESGIALSKNHERAVEIVAKYGEFSGSPVIM